jgi:hypothetical protein
MRRVLWYVAVWCGATGLAISLAWFGVRDVLRAEVAPEGYGAVPVAVVTRTGPPPTRAPGGVTTLTPESARTPTRPPVRRPAAEPKADPTAGPGAEPSAPRTPVPAPTRPRTTSPARPLTQTPLRSPIQTPAQASARSSPAPTDVKVITVKGGQVSFSTAGGECKLLWATPAAGYEAKVSGNVGWIRVDLTQGEHGSSVFCTWHGFAPTTDVYEF